MAGTGAAGAGLVAHGLSAQQPQLAKAAHYRGMREEFTRMLSDE
jgi:hypothetical protein